jgi:hypothetical protein
MAGQYFIPLRNLLKKFIEFDVDQLALEISRTPTFKKLVISLNTEGLPTSQLFELGQDAQGRTLESIGGEYSPFTVEVKRRKGQPTDRITLKDTGDFYRTFDVIPFKGGFRIEADTIKDGQDLQDSWGKEIVGIDQRNLLIIIEFYKNAIQEKVKSSIKAA